MQEALATRHSCSTLRATIFLLARNHFGYLRTANSLNDVTLFDTVNAYAPNGGTDTFNNRYLVYTFIQQGTWENIV